MKRDFIEWVIYTGKWSLITLTILIILMVVACLSDERTKNDCIHDAEMMKTEYQYTVRYGCYLKDGNRYLPRDALIPSRNNHATYVPIVIPAYR